MYRHIVTYIYCDKYGMNRAGDTLTGRSDSGLVYRYTVVIQVEYTEMVIKVQIDIVKYV